MKQLQHPGAAGVFSAAAKLRSTGQRALDARPRTVRIWPFAARVLGLRADLEHGGVVTDGDANELVGDLATTLYGDRRALVNEEL